jgi:hypothetical protein
MKFLVVVFCFLAFASFATAQDPSPSPVASPIVITPAVGASPAMALVPLPTPVPVPVGDVAVSAPSAPPQWAQDLIMNAQKLPVVGPYVAKGLLYLGILSAILTALVAFLLAAAMALKGVLNFAGLNSFVVLIQAFQDGPVMYWLKYLSMFNAQKKSE